MNLIYWTSFCLGLATISTVYVTMSVLALPWRERLGLGLLGAGTLFSFWMGLIPKGHLETWPFLLGRAGIIILMEAVYGERVRRRLATQWTIGKLADLTATDADSDALAAEFSKPPLEYGIHAIPGTTILPPNAKR